MPVKNNIFLLCIALINCPTILKAQADSHFVFVPGGTYTIGKKGHLLNPQRKVNVSGYYIGKTEITNQQFEEFIKATSYRTDAERMHNAMVFQPGLKEFEWIEDSTAFWRYPNGISRGDIEYRKEHPVTCISYSDILAYCKWAGMRLPTLEEWEIACRAGSDADHFFGNDRSRIKQYANIWHGKDHLAADSSDGFLYTSPVGSFAPNPWGLYDMYGNVFEFCTGKLKENEKSTIAHARGGSWWCSKNACSFFNSYDIGRVHIHASFSNQGFRVVKL
jgi:sulfatase modifying factor 1